MIDNVAKVGLFWQSFFAFIVFVLAYWGVTYTSDWDGYIFFFNHSEMSRDPMFAFLSEFFKNRGYTFIDLYKFHIILISFFFIYIFKSTRVNPLLLIFISIVFNYVAIGNQIRFYLAFPLVLLAFFELVTKRYVLTVLLFIIAILEHKSVIILFAVLVVFKFLVYRLSLKKQMLLILLANIIIFFLLNFSDSFDEKYDDYQSAGNISSLAGGIFNVVPYLLPIYSCVRISKILGKKAPELKDKPIYEFLYTCSIAPMVFLMSGLYVQVLANRFVITFLPIWFAFFIYVHRHPLQKRTKKTISIMAWTSIMILIFWMFCLMPQLGFVDYFIETYLMLSSYRI